MKFVTIGDPKKVRADLIIVQLNRIENEYISNDAALFNAIALPATTEVIQQLRDNKTALNNQSKDILAELTSLGKTQTVLYDEAVSGKIGR